MTPAPCTPPPALPPAADEDRVTREEGQLLDILIAETAHLGRRASSPARRIASGRVETRLRDWKQTLTA